MDDNKSIMHNSFMYMIKTIVGIVVPLVILPYVTRTLGPVGVGKVQYAQSWITYFQLFACLGTSYYAIREGVKYKDDVRTLSKFTKEILIISLFATIISYIALVIFILASPNLYSYRFLMLIFSVLILSNAMNTEWMCTIYEDYGYITKRTVIIQLISLALLFILVRNEYDLNQYAIVLTFPSVAIMLWNYIYLSKKVSLKVRVKLSIGSHIVPILFIFGSTIASTVYTTLDTTMLGVLSGDNAVGLYYAASRFVKSVLTVVTASCTVFLPRLSFAASQSQTDSFKNLTKKAVSVLALFSIPCCLGLMLLSKEILYIFSGSEYCQAAISMKVLSVDLFFSAFNGFLAWQILVPLKKEKYMLLATSIGCMLDFILNFVLIPKYDIDGAAVATLCSEIIVFVILNAFIRQELPKFNPYKPILKYFIAVIPFTIVSFLVRNWTNNPWLITIIMVPICMAIYVLVLLIEKDPIIILIRNKVRNLIVNRSE